MFESRNREIASFFNTDDFPEIDEWWSSLSKKILIGRGTFSTAYLVTGLDMNKYIVRITPVIGTKERNILQREIDMYQTLRSDTNALHYISELLYADYPTKYHNREEYDQSYFVFRYVEGVPLDTFIQSFQSKKYITLTKLQDWANHMLKILKFLRLHKIVHRDIKPANLFVDTTNDRLVVFDFGSACFEGEDCKTTEFHGTRAYASPNSLTLLSESLPPSYEYSYANDEYAVKLILQTNIVKLVAPEDITTYRTIVASLGI